MQGRMNIPTRGGGGGEVSLNVFAQAAEPSIKNGIWINTSASGSLPLIEKFDYNGIEIANSDFRNVKNGEKAYLLNGSTPHNFTGGASIAVGTDIYLFGGNDSTGKRYAYKYDTTTGTYTKLTNIPYNFYSGAIAAVGTDIYLFGTQYSPDYYKYAYKYDTTTGTYTKLTDIPYTFYGGAAAAVGTDIYLFGGKDSTSKRYAYKYDTTTGTYTQLTNIPYNFYGGAIAAVGTDIYLFGTQYSSDYYKYAYKYNTTTGKYTKLTDIPYNFYRGAIAAVGTDIYLFGTQYSSDYYKYAYKYNTTTGKYTKLTDKTHNFSGGAAAAVGTDIYLFGTGDVTLKCIDLQLKNKYIYLFTLQNRFETQISNNLNIPVIYARICKDNKLQAYPAYYGDGTQWNRLLG